MTRLFLVGVVLFVIVTSLASGDHLVDISDEIGNQLLLNITIAKKAVPGGRASTKYTYRALRDSFITQIYADNTEENGAEVSITEGGVHRSYVAFKFLSAQNKGFSFNVFIYGRHPPNLKGTYPTRSRIATNTAAYTTKFSSPIDVTQPPKHTEGITKTPKIQPIVATTNSLEPISIIA